jgi:hypothetical protein
MATADSVSIGEHLASLRRTRETYVQDRLAQFHVARHALENAVFAFDSLLGTTEDMVPPSVIEAKDMLGRLQQEPTATVE